MGNKMSGTAKKDLFIVSGTGNQIQAIIDRDLNLQHTHALVEFAVVPKSYLMLGSDETVTITDTLGSYVVDFPRGNYTPSVIAASFNTVTAYTCTPPGRQGQVDTGKFIWSTARTDPSFNVSDGDLGRMLGLPAGETAFVGVLESVNAISLQRYDIVYIRSDLVADRSQILQPIFSAGVAYNTDLLYQPHDVTVGLRQMTTAKCNLYRFWITDGDGEIIDLRGVRWSLVLSLVKFV